MKLPNWLKWLLVSNPPADTGLLPADRITRHLADLAVGEVAWCVPWAMKVDKHRRCYLNLRSTALDKKEGAANLRVVKTERGWVVNIWWVGDDKSWDVDKSPQGVPVLVVMNEPEE